jgi:hypothetical protein
LLKTTLSYERIGANFGLSRQRIAQLAKELRIDADQRLRDRRLTRPPRVIVEPYPPHVAAVIKLIKRSGLKVLPYDVRQAYEDNLYRRSQNKVLVSGVLCDPSAAST